MSYKFELEIDELVCRCSRVYDTVLEVRVVRNHLNSWDITEGQSFMQIFPSNIVYHLSIYMGEEKMLEMTRSVLANRQITK